MTRLRMWREEKRLTQAEAAGALGISRPSYAILERGQIYPSRGMLAALERVFGDRGRDMLSEVKVRLPV